MKINYGKFAIIIRGEIKMKNIIITGVANGVRKAVAIF